MSTATMTSKQFIEDYFKLLSGNPKTEQLVDEYVDDPNLRKHILESETAFPGYELAINQIVGEDEMVAVNATFTGTHKGTFAGIEATGKTVSVGAMLFYRISNGKIAEFWMQLDAMSLFGQLKG